MNEQEAKILIEQGFSNKVPSEFHYLLETPTENQIEGDNTGETPDTTGKKESIKLNMDKSGNLGVGSKDFQKNQGEVDIAGADVVTESSADVADSTDEVELDLADQIFNELHSRKKVKREGDIRFNDDPETSKVKLSEADTSGAFIMESGKGIFGIFTSFFRSMEKRQIQDWGAYPSSLMQVGFLTIIISLIVRASPLNTLLFYSVPDLLKGGSIALLTGLLSKIIFTLSVAPSEAEVKLWEQEDAKLEKAIRERKENKKPGSFLSRDRLEKQEPDTNKNRKVALFTDKEETTEEPNIKKAPSLLSFEEDTVEEEAEGSFGLSFSKEQIKKEQVVMIFEDDTDEEQEIYTEEEARIEEVEEVGPIEVQEELPERANAKGRVVLLSDGTEVRQTAPNYYTPASLYRRLVPTLPTHNKAFKEETIILPPEKATDPTTEQILKAHRYLEYFRNALKFEFSSTKQPDDLDDFKFSEFIERGTHYCAVFKRLERITVKALIQHKAAIANYFKEDEAVNKTMKIQFQSSGTSVYLFIFKFYGVADGIEGIDMRVTIGDVLADPKMYRKFMPRDVFKGTDIQMPLGYTDDGTVISNSYYDDPHGLTSGETGSGKSWTIGTSLYYLAAITNPADNRFILFDPGDTLIYRELAKLPHTIGYMQADAVNTGELNRLLQLYIDLFEDRSRLFSEVGAEDIGMYNKKFPDKKLPYIYLFIDEVNSLDQEFNDKDMFKEFKSMVLYISAKLRKYGAKLHLIPQRPVEPFVTKTTREQLKRRIFLNPNISDVESLFGSDNSDLKGLEFAGRGSGLISCTKLAEMKKMQFTVLGAKDEDFFGTMSSIADTWGELGAKTTYEPIMLQVYRLLNHFDAQGELMTWQKKFLRDFPRKQLQVYDKARDSILNLHMIEAQQDDASGLQVGKKSSFIQDADIVYEDEQNDSVGPVKDTAPEVSDKNRNIVDGILGDDEPMTITDFIEAQGGIATKQELIEKFGNDDFKEAVLNIKIKAVSGDLNKFKVWK